MTKKSWILFAGIVIRLLSLNFTSGKPLVNSQRSTHAKPSSNLVQNSITFDDVVSTPICTTKDDYLDEPSDNSDFTTRNGVKNIRRRWNSFYLLLDPTFEKWERDVIDQSMGNISKIIPCVKFGIYPSSARPRGDYVKVVKGSKNGCNSAVGRQGGRQVMNLQSPGCLHVGTVMHELLHALGFHHEHSRYDRDDFITIQWKNMQPKYKFSFEKKSTSVTTTYGVPYNYNSIMHYHEWAFSKNHQPTMIAKNGQKLGSTGKLQQTDIEKLKAMYKC